MPVQLIYEEYITTGLRNVCQQCRPHHGKIYLRGQGPQPPLHFGCRCYRRYHHTETLPDPPQPPAAPPIGPSPQPSPAPPPGPSTQPPAAPPIGPSPQPAPAPRPSIPRPPTIPPSVRPPRRPRPDGGTLPPLNPNPDTPQDNPNP